jgi:hypothetical protein
LFKEDCLNEQECFSHSFPWEKISAGLAKNVKANLSGCNKYTALPAFLICDETHHAQTRISQGFVSPPSHAAMPGSMIECSTTPLTD